MTGVGLLDVNVLVALAWPNHLGHTAARAWLARTGQSSGWSTTPITEAGFVRVSSNRTALPMSTSPANAVQALRALSATTGHEFWLDDLRYVTDEPLLTKLRGHKQITDAHLVSLARRHQGHLVTFDRAITSLADGTDVEVLEASV